MKLYTKESLIKTLIEIRQQGWIPTERKDNDGGVGNTLEDLLGIEENNLPSDRFIFRCKTVLKI